MPYSSADISGMIGGQMAMFSNQAAFSQQIGGMVGTGSPVGMAGNMSNPYPTSHMGSQIAGGIGMMGGGAATAMSIGGGLMGGAAGWADPFTAAGRGLAAGTGASGFTAGLANIGGAFAQGGMRAGMGMLAGGIGGAAIAAAPAMAVGAAVQYAGGQIYQGAQNIEDVRSMSGHFGSQFGAAGGVGTSGGMSHGTIKKITGALHELVGEDMRTTMEEVKSIMDKAGQMGMLSGITDANAFKQKFGGIVKQVRQIADIMGTTLSEAAPMMGQMNQMGLWTSADMMGTAIAGRVAGPAAGQMMGAMSQGAQVSHAYGGTMRAGAMMGREAFGTIQAAQRAGVISNRDVMEYTGGVGGAEGQQMMAGGVQRILSKFSQTPAGQLMIAGLGERGETGEFTGSIDKGRLNEFLSGGVSVDDLQKMGQKNLTKGNQASFFDVQEELGQNLGAEGGIGAIGKMAEGILGNRFGGNSKLKQALLKQIADLSNRDAKLAKTFIENQGKIADQAERSAEDAINQSFENLHRRQYRSWEGLKDAASHTWREGVSRPLQEAGESLATGIGDTWDRSVSKVTGGTRRIAMGSAERGRLIRGGALTADYSNLDMGTVGQSFATGEPMENMIRGLRSTSVGEIYGRTTAAAITGGMSELGIAAYNEYRGDPGTEKQQALRRMGIGVKGGPGDIDLGAGFRTTEADLRKGLARGFMRAQTPTSKAFGFDTVEGKQKITEFKNDLRKVMGQSSEELRRLKKDDPEGYAEAVLKKMGKPVTSDNLDALAYSQAEEGYASDLSADFKSMSASAGSMPSNPKELAEYQADRLSEIADTVGAGTGLLGAGLAVVTGGASLLWAAKSFMDSGGEEEAAKALTGKGADVVNRYLNKEISKEEAVYQLRGNENQSARRMIATGQADEKKEQIQQFLMGRGKQAKLSSMPGLKAMAARGPGEIKLGRGGESAAASFKEVVGLYRGGADEDLDEKELDSARLKALELGRSISVGQARKMQRKGGDIGRNIAAISRAARFGGGDKAASEQLLSDLSNQGYDIDKMAEASGDERMQEILSDRTISADEAEEFGKKAGEWISKSMSETAEARKTQNEKMMGLLNTYAEKHEKFVRAVDNAIDLKDPGDAPELDKPTDQEKK